MTEQMAAMKLQDDKEAADQAQQQHPNRNEQQGTSYTTNNQSNQGNNNTSEALSNNLNRQTIGNREQSLMNAQAKRQRMETTLPTIMEVTMTDNHMAGPAGQASQLQ
jgi:hypothetical protein